jgi:hypothetical protein
LIWAGGDLIGTEGKEGEAQGRGQEESQSSEEGTRETLLEAEVKIVAKMSPELLREDRVSLTDLVHGLLECCVTDSKGRPHGQVRIKEVSFESVASAGDDGESGVGEGARVELRRSPEDHGIVPIVSLEREEATHVCNAICHDRLRRQEMSRGREVRREGKVGED